MTNTQIGFVLCERMLSSGLSLPIEMWKAAASSYLAEQKKTSHAGTHKPEKSPFRLCRPENILKVNTIGINSEPILTHSGFSITADTTLAADRHYDVIYLPALWRNPRAVVSKEPELLEWLTEQAAREPASPPSERAAVFWRSRDCSTESLPPPTGTTSNNSRATTPA